jgi:hypothetical protein
MDCLVEQPFATALGTLALVLFDVGNQAGVEDRFAIGRRVKATIEVDIGALEVQPALLAYPLQSLQSFRQQHRIGFIDGRDGKGCQYIAVVVNDGDDFFALLVFMTGVPNAVAAFFGYRVGAIAWFQVFLYGETVTFCAFAPAGPIWNFNLS